MPRKNVQYYFVLWSVIRNFAIENGKDNSTEYADNGHKAE